MGATRFSDPEAAPGEGPEREVTIHQGFWMGKFAVTVEEYGRVMGQPALQEVLARIPAASDLAFAHHRKPRKPVTQVTWYEAVAFCERLTALELPETEDAGSLLPPGHVDRLPTSAEWEYACRAGVPRQPCYGELHTIAWTAGSTASSAGRDCVRWWPATS